jgi:hypothetical protein
MVLEAGKFNFKVLASGECFCEVSFYGRKWKGKNMGENKKGKNMLLSGPHSCDDKINSFMKMAHS